MADHGGAEAPSVGEQPARAPQPLRATRGPSEVALGTVLLVVLVGLALVGQDHWRRGLLLVGGGLLLG
ncbi:MAG: hypothetical protein QOC80_2681, partial [Frankiaceae bacterium]|nr:hypothetical protein [Frankiaceae bacterium]